MEITIRDREPVEDLLIIKKGSMSDYDPDYVDDCVTTPKPNNTTPNPNGKY